MKKLKTLKTPKPTKEEKRIRAIEGEAYVSQDMPVNPIISIEPLAQMRNIFLKVTYVDGPKARHTANNKFLKNLAKRKK
jgi:hypothetical protein